MRKIINSTYITLDGVVEAPHHWPALPGGAAAESDEIQAELLRHCDAVLMGRRTYDVFAPVWPNYDGEVAERMNAADKVVVSSTLTEPAMAHVEPVVSLNPWGLGAPFCCSEHVSQSLRDKPPSGPVPQHRTMRGVDEHGSDR